MKSLCYYQHGGLDVLRYDDVADPVPGKGQVLVKVKACALNHLDIWVMRGLPGLDLEMPHWGGSDIAGVIAGLGPEVTGLETGQRVVIDHGINPVEDEFTRRGEHSMSPRYVIIGEHTRGGLAEYIVVPEQNAVKIPDNVDFPEACAPLLVTLTAWRMLINRAKLRAGETVLTVGAGGGVNSASIQIAKLAGARVIVTSSSDEKLQRAMKLGADFAVNYREQPDVAQAVHGLTDGRGVDIAVDTVGAATWPIDFAAVRRGGRIVLCGVTTGATAETPLSTLYWNQLTILGSTMGSHEDFRLMVSAVAAAGLKPVIDRIVPLDDGPAAQARMESGDQFGKIVLRVG